MSKKKRNTALTTQSVPPSKDDSPINYILETQKLRARQDILKLKVAIDAAENIENYDRELLHDIYRDIIDDPILESQWNTRKMKTKEKPFKIVQKGSLKEDPEMTKVLEAEWFFMFIDAVLDAQQWGFTLVEFGPMLPTGEFLPYTVNKKLYPAVNVIERDNVVPELGLIVNTPGAIDGISMLDPRFANQVMFLGSYRSHGWLRKAAKFVLFKQNCFGNWSEWAEVFGMDKRIGYTDVAETNARERFIRAIRDLGSNAYAVFGSRDKVEYVGTNRADAYGVYEHLIDKVDEGMSKLIFGQDVVSNQTGRIVGTVGENVSNMYGTHDCNLVQFAINTRLFPMMSNLGFKGFDGKLFMFDNTEKLSLKDRSEVDSKIVTMTGRKLDPKYVEETYGVKLGDEEKPNPAPAQ